MALSAPSNAKNPNAWTPTDNTIGVTGGIHDVSHGGAFHTYNTLAYPKDLGTIRYPYYMVFYINASSKSALGKASKVTNIADKGAGQKVTAGKITTALPKIVKNINRTISEINPFLLDHIGMEISAIDPVALNEALTTLMDFAPPPKRLKQTVALPIPSSLNFASQAEYQDASSGFLGSLINDVAGSGGVDRGLRDVVVKAKQTIISGVANAIGGVFGSGASPNFDLIANRLRNTTQNQRKEQVFTDVTTRTFSFDWLFVPKTEKESQDIKDIIYFFKYNMHPEVMGSDAKETELAGFNLIMPNEFDIEFESMNNGESSETLNSLPKISTCVLKDCSVNYTPLGKFIAFNDKDGKPTGNAVAVHLSMTFSEIEPLTRSKIMEGY